MEDHGSLRSAIATMATAAQWQRALLLAEPGDIFGGALRGVLPGFLKVSEVNKPKITSYKTLGKWRFYLPVYNSSKWKFYRDPPY